MVAKGEKRGNTMKGHNYGSCRKCGKEHLFTTGMLGKKHDIETRKKISKRLKGVNVWSKGRKLTPEHIAKRTISRKGYRCSEETKEKIRLANTGNTWGFQKGHKVNCGRKHTPEYILMMKERNSLEKNPNWVGFEASFPYSPYWKLIRKEVMERDEKKCQNCLNLGVEQISKVLTIHHIDYNKMNNLNTNLITLCQTCHNWTTNAHYRDFWVRYYKKLMVEKKCIKYAIYA